MYPFRFKLPDKSIRTGYGVRWAKNEEQNAEYYSRLAEKAGFKFVSKINQKPSFYLELQKFPLFAIPLITDTLQLIIDTKGIQGALYTYSDLKRTRPNDFLFTQKGLEKLCISLYTNGKINESLEIALLIFKEYDLDEGTINTYGFEYLNDEKTNEAIKIFQFNTQKFPHSANTYCSLGKANLKLCNNSLAIENIEKSLSLDPQNINTEQLLKQLKGK